MRDDGDGIVLTGPEAVALGFKMAADQLEETQDWLHWEDVPLLTLDAFEMVNEAIRVEVADLVTERLKRFEVCWGISGESIWKRVL